MSCKEYQHQITLLLYEELPESARTELETHIQECAHCNDAYESEKSMHIVLAEDAALPGRNAHGLEVISRDHPDRRGRSLALGQWTFFDVE